MHASCSVSSRHAATLRFGHTISPSSCTRHPPACLACMRLGGYQTLAHRLHMSAQPSAFCLSCCLAVFLLCRLRRLRSCAHPRHAAGTDQLLAHFLCLATHANNQCTMLHPGPCAPPPEKTSSFCCSLWVAFGELFCRTLRRSPTPPTHFIKTYQKPLTSSRFPFHRI
jgi:hypothetical protein